MLRTDIVRAALDGDERLDAFLASDSPAEQLALWFGRIADRALIARDIAALDALLGAQVDAILHHPALQALEASWRGVDHLLDAIEGDERVRVRLMNATWAELARDFDRSAEFDRSALFEKIYNEEYGMPGGTPYGLLLCDYEVRHRYPAESGIVRDDIGALGGVAGVAAAAFTPTVIAAAPELFGVGNFAELSYAQKLESGFMLPEYQRWRRLQAQEDARFLGVLLPRVLLRDRRGDDPARSDGFRYMERGTGDDIEHWLWGNAVYAFGAVAIRAFRDWGWFADIRGARPDGEDAGLVTDLPVAAYSTDEPTAYRRPLEVELTDRKQKVLEELGFIALSPCAFTPSAVFLGAPSLHQAVGTDRGDAAAAANERLSSMLQYVLCVSRFAHYIKVMARDRIGAFVTADELQRYLSDWLRNYMIGNADAGLELKAKYPLSGGSVEVTERPDKPGTMHCVIHLQPHFQLDQIVTAFRLQTELAAPRTS